MPSEQNQFDKLDKGIREWLQSDTVFQIVFDLNKKIGAFGSELACIPSAIVNIATGLRKPEEFFVELSKGLPYLDDKDIEQVATSIKQRVLTPIKALLKNKQGIEVSLVSTTRPETKFTAHTMKIERAPAPPPAATTTKMAATPPPPPRPVPAPQPAPTARVIQPEIPKVRTMQMANVIDLRRPMSSTVPTAPAAAAKTQQAGGPTAQTMKMEGTLGSSANRPVSTGSTSAPTKESPANSPKKVEGEHDVLEAEKPFGLAEAVPVAPSQPAPAAPAPAAQPKASAPAQPPHEIVEYHDEHPAVDKKS